MCASWTLWSHGEGTLKNSRFAGFHLGIRRFTAGSVDMNVTQTGLVLEAQTDVHNQALDAQAQTVQ